MTREQAITYIIEQHTFSAKHKATPVDGDFIVGQTIRGEAICLCWKNDTWGDVDHATLRAMFQEARARGLSKPIYVYGATTVMGETETFYFFQQSDY